MVLKSFSVALLTLVAALIFFPASLAAHCDSMNGPVVLDAKRALENENLDAVLRWLKPEHEAEIKSLFAKTLSVRKMSPEAREIADRLFFENVVRLHRAGEGAPYTGLREDEAVDPVLTAADKALEAGSVDALNATLTHRTQEALQNSFAAVIEKKKNRDKSVAAGREYVEAYVTFIHLAEKLGEAAKTEHHTEGSSEHKH